MYISVSYDKKRNHLIDANGSLWAIVADDIRYAAVSREDGQAGIWCRRDGSIQIVTEGCAFGVNAEDEWVVNAEGAWEENA